MHMDKGEQLMSVDQKDIDDKEMVIQLHNIARIMEEADANMGFEIRKIADRFSELTSKAATRRHWTGTE